MSIRNFTALKRKASALVREPRFKRKMAMSDRVHGRLKETAATLTVDLGYPITMTDVFEMLALQYLPEDPAETLMTPEDGEAIENVL